MNNKIQIDFNEKISKIIRELNCKKNLKTKLFVFGCNEYGQLGLGHYDSTITPRELISLKNITAVSCGGNHTAIVSGGRLLFSVVMNIAN